MNNLGTNEVCNFNSMQWKDFKKERQKYALNVKDLDIKQKNAHLVQIDLSYYKYIFFIFYYSN